MHIPILYLDTSVIGGYFDEEWKDATQELWRQMEQGLFRFAASIITSQELRAAPECVRDLFAQTFKRPEMVILDVTDEVDDLTAAYMRQAVVPAKYTDDARHVAVCVVAKADYLVSWNFKHLVNVNRGDAFNAVNLLQGYPPVRILSPLELIYGNQNKEL